MVYYVDVILNLLSLLVALVIAIAPIIVTRVQTGRFDLLKTLEAAEDVAHVIDDAEECIKKIEEIRGKKLSRKMERKARARVARVKKQIEQ